MIKKLLFIIPFLFITVNAQDSLLSRDSLYQKEIKEYQQNEADITKLQSAGYEIEQRLKLLYAMREEKGKRIKELKKK